MVMDLFDREPEQKRAPGRVLLIRALFFARRGEELATAKHEFSERVWQELTEKYPDHVHVVVVGEPDRWIIPDLEKREIRFFSVNPSHVVETIGRMRAILEELGIRFRGGGVESRRVTWTNVHDYVADGEVLQVLANDHRAFGVTPEKDPTKEELLRERESRSKWA